MMNISRKNVSQRLTANEALAHRYFSIHLQPNRDGVEGKVISFFKKT